MVFAFPALPGDKKATRKSLTEGTEEHGEGKV
jgi:hypothetical protein